VGYGASIETLVKYNSGGIRMSFFQTIAEIFGMTYDDESRTPVEDPDIEIVVAEDEEE